MLDSYNKTIQTLGTIYKEEGENGVIKAANLMRVEISSSMMAEIVAFSNGAQMPVDAPQSLATGWTGETVGGNINDIVGMFAANSFPVSKGVTKGLKRVIQSKKEG